MADLYREKVTQLARGLGHEESRTAAAEALRGLIDAIVLTPAEGALEAHVVSRGRRARGPAKAGHHDGPEDSGLQIQLKGNLVAMVSAAAKATRSPETGDLELQIAMVAGAGFEPATFGL
jgi:site-specific DNA recombinase